MPRYATRLLCQSLGLLLLMSAGTGQALELWRSGDAGASERKTMPLANLVAQYQEHTSLQQDARNRALEIRNAGFWVTDSCIVEDVQASNEFSSIKNDGFEVECRTNRPTPGTKAMLYLPRDAQSAVTRLRKGERIEFRGLASKVDGLSQIKTAHVWASSLYDSGGAAPAKVPAVPKLNGAMDQVRKQLIAAGWQPRPVETPGEVVGSDVREMRALGLPELEACAGTGINPCTFNYVKDGACLRVISVGEMWEEKGRKRLPNFDNYQRACP